MREIDFYILVGTIVLILGFSTLPRGFVAVGIVATVAATIAVILLEG
jgi:hypothetical protein